MRLVVVESPYAGDVARNVEYARACVADCLRRGESPYASHLFFPQVLDDMNPEERKLGIMAGFAWAEQASTRAIYIDRGLSSGMKQGILHAVILMQRIELRSIEDRDVCRHIELAQSQADYERAFKAIAAGPCGHARCAWCRTDRTPHRTYLCGDCGALAQHVEGWNNILGFRAWCEKHTPWSGHYEHCPEPCRTRLERGVPPSEQMFDHPRELPGLPCPDCHEDCNGWVVDGRRCGPFIDTKGDRR